MGLYINGQKLAKPYINGTQYNAYLNGQRIWAPPPSFEKVMLGARDSYLVKATSSISHWGQVLFETYPQLIAPVSITASNKRYVAINGIGEYSTSYNGAYWATPQLMTSTSGNNTSNTANKWLQIIYDSNKFVAWNIDGRYAYSTNGTNWVENKVNFSFIKKVLYVNGMYVILTSFGLVYLSNNLIDWSRITLPQTELVYSDIAFGDGKFIAVNVYGKLAISTDCINWTLRNGGKNYYSICYGKEPFNAFYILQSDGVVERYYAPNDILYQITTLEPADQLNLWSSILYANGYIFATKTAYTAIYNNSSWVNINNRISNVFYPS
jgi:hypothetical protein